MICALRFPTFPVVACRGKQFRFDPCRSERHTMEREEIQKDRSACNWQNTIVSILQTNRPLFVLQWKCHHQEDFGSVRD